MILEWSHLVAWKGTSPLQACLRRTFECKWTRLQSNAPIEFGERLFACVPVVALLQRSCVMGR